MSAALMRNPAVDAAVIGRSAADSLKLEVATHPKPGLVTPIDNGAHADMDAAMLVRSADALEPFFAHLAGAGAAGAHLRRLRSIGIAAEAAMRIATGGINTHRGAIFGLGLLCAAAGLRSRHRVSGTLGDIVRHHWGAEILASSGAPGSHGSHVARLHGAGGARSEAAAGFPSLYTHALPALAERERFAPDEPEAARVHACMALIATVDDTNLLFRGGTAGLAYAQSEARRFLAAGGVGMPDWYARAQAMNRAFVARNLSPGGCADLLAMALFVRAYDGDATAMSGARMYE